MDDMLNVFMRITPLTLGCRDEYDYVYIWRDRYKCVDATYLNMRHSRESSLAALRVYIWKLRYLNPYMGDLVISEFVIKTLNRAVLGGGIFLTETDIYNEIYSIFNYKDIPHNITEVVMSSRRSEWKVNSRSLTDDLGLDDRGIKEIRRKYLGGCLRWTNRLVRTEKIESILKGVDTITVDELADMLNISKRSVKASLKGIIAVNVAVSDRKRVKNDNIEKIQEEVSRMLRDGERVTKDGVRRNIDLGRNTISRWWGMIDV